MYNPYLRKRSADTHARDVPRPPPETRHENPSPPSRPPRHPPDLPPRRRRGPPDRRSHRRSLRPHPRPPFGRPNPEAPPELRQFDFLVGVHHCDSDRIHPDGRRERAKIAWTGRYILNGQAIQDSGIPTATNVRIFDPRTRKWRVTYFNMPEAFSQVWEGTRREDGRIVLETELQPPGVEPYVSRLTFSEVSEKGFRWTAEQVFEEEGRTVWEMRCRRT